MSENQNNSDNKNKELGALWKRKSKDGSQTYLAGHLVSEDEFGQETRTKIVVFSNSKKTNERQPDFRMYLSKEQQNQGQTQAQNTSKPVQATEEEVL